MKGLCTIGEVLIDFIPQEKGKRIKDVCSFEKAAGGAPANVAGAAAMLGANAVVLSQVGCDAFGDYLIECMKDKKINTSYVKKSECDDTSLAFVSLAKDGNRDFKFYRKTAADLQYTFDEESEKALENIGILHFCSVDLVDSPMKKAHQKIIELAISKKILVSFDPNIRLSLWDNHAQLRDTVHTFMRYADIIKVSDDELDFICGTDQIEEALPLLLKDRCKLLIITKGKNGALSFTKNEKAEVKGWQVDAVDSTGAGDAFIGSFLFQLLKYKRTDLDSLNKDELSSYLYFSNLYAAYITTQKGGLASMADMNTIHHFKLDCTNK